MQASGLTIVGVDTTEYRKLFVADEAETPHLGEGNRVEFVSSVISIHAKEFK